MKVGIVSQVDSTNKTIRAERLGIVSQPLYMLKNPDIEPVNFPIVGQRVVYEVIDGTGICFGILVGATTGEII